MANPENVRESGQPDHTPDRDRRITIQATPHPETPGIVFQKAPNGGTTIWFQGEITIDLPPAVSQATEAVVSAEGDTKYRLLTPGTPPPRSEGQSTADTTASDKPGSEGAPIHSGPAVPETVEKVVRFTPYTESEPRESILSASEAQGNGLVPDNTTESVSVQFSVPDVPASEASEPKQLHIPESENEKHEFVGNPVRDPAYWERRSGKKVAEFILATHPDKEKTLYHRIRAFDKQAERVRDTVRRSQTDVAVVAYGPKYWPVTRRTKDGQEKQEVVQGYYAGFVNVPKRYREDSAEQSLQQPLK